MTARQKRYLESVALRLNGELFDCPDCNGQRFRKLAEELQAKLLASYRRASRKAKKEPLEWRCFRCGAVFTDATEAARHFGPDQKESRATACDLMLQAFTETFERFGVHRNFHNAASVGLLVEKLTGQSPASYLRQLELAATAAATAARHQPDEGPPGYPAINP